MQYIYANDILDLNLRPLFLFKWNYPRFYVSFSIQFKHFHAKLGLNGISNPMLKSLVTSQK